MKRVLMLMVSLSLVMPVYAVKLVERDLRRGFDVITQARLKQDLAYLTANKREGRLALSRGDEDTTQWLVEQFKSAGLQPANNGSYLQTFKVIEYVPDVKNSSLSITGSEKNSSWKKPDIFSYYPDNLDATGAIVFAGYGITAPAMQYDDYKNIDVKGKFVLVFEHEPQETDKNSIFNGTGNTPYATTRIKAINAARHGAIGLLVAPEPNRKHPSNQERYKNIGGSANRKIPLPEMALKDDEVRIPVVVLSDKVAKKLAAPLNLSELQRNIDKDLSSQSQVIPGRQIELKERVKSRREAETSNVVGLLPGADDMLNVETVIISAHHDHDGKSGKQIWHGADDNASGTAGVVNVARAMNANSDLKPKRSVLFAVFAAEERGLLGSYYMTAHPLRPLATTRAVINFDMIGRDEKQTPQTKGLIYVPERTKNRLNLIGAHFSPDYDKVVRAQNEYVGLDLDDRFDSENALNTFFRSDQFPFVLNEVPAFWWFTGFHPDYHHTTDTADRIDYPKMQKILQLAYLSAYQFANTETPPAFIANPRP